MRSKPADHTLYWVYINYRDGAYNFDTTTRKDEAMTIAKQFMDEPDWEDVVVYWGNENAAFTQYDPIKSWYR